MRLVSHWTSQTQIKIEHLKYIQAENRNEIIFSLHEGTPTLLHSASSEESSLLPRKFTPLPFQVAASFGLSEAFLSIAMDFPAVVWFLPHPAV